MFVFSLKANKTRVIILLAMIVAALALIFFFTGKNAPVINDGGINRKASNEQERVAFLSQFGWEINEDPSAVEEVVIPAEFDETYRQYNELQISQGFDLTKYAGKTAKKWTYEVKNYPGYSADNNCIRANILVFDGAVIGGDVSSTEQGGFMQTFDYPQSTPSENPQKSE